MKRLVFVGASLDDLSAFPAEARRVAGHELWQVQNGLIPSDFKPMRAVGAGAYEIRIHVLRDGAIARFRVSRCAKPR